MTRLAGAHVLISGGSRGIGRCLAEEMSKRGARLTLVARDPVALAEAAARADAASLLADLCDPAAYVDLIERAEDQEGPIDVLVNNAGSVHAAWMPNQTINDLRRALELNLHAPMQLTRQVLPGMLRRGHGHIVNVGSLAAYAVFPGLVPYSSAKAGLAHFSAGLRVDLHGSGIKITHVDIGPVDTGALHVAKMHPPARASYVRAYRVKLLVDVAPEVVANKIIRAIERDRRVVRTPRRAAALGVMVEVPRRAAELLLTGVSRRG